MRKVVHSGCHVAGIIATVWLLEVPLSHGWHDANAWASTVGCAVLLLLLAAGGSAKAAWDRRPRLGHVVHSVTFCAGICLAVFVPGDFAVNIGAGIAGGAATSAYIAFAPKRKVEWRRLSRPLRPILNVIWGDANRPEPGQAEDRGLGS